MKRLNNFVHVWGFKFLNAAPLEYLREDLEYLQNYGADHHFGEWDEIYRRCGRTKPTYDLWLDKYKNILEDSRHIPIIDLGCGYGNDTLYLHERGYSVISCDLSKEALKRLDYFIDNPVKSHFDMLEGLPFGGATVGVVIADLSLHYFLWEDTKKIVGEIRRVLANDGYLLCRVNSINNKADGSGRGIMIEENYYEVRGRRKRFFDRVDLERLFRAWDIVHMEEYSLNRFGSNKILWETAIRKI